MFGNYKASLRDTMTTETYIAETLHSLQQTVPGGFAIALHVRFTTPTYLFQTYPKAWVDHYSQNGLVMDDPTVAWGFANVGTSRWSSLTADDPANVMQQAFDHGLRFGVTVAIDANDSRSFASFSDPHAEFTDQTISMLHQQVEQFHNATAGLADLSPEAYAKLKKMSVTVGPR